MSARIAIFALGSRGDVEPFLALALMLKSRGHDVVLAAPDDFRGMVGRYGIEFASIGSTIRDMLDLPDTRKAIAGNPLAIVKTAREQALPMIEGALDALEANGFDADVLIHHPKVMGVSDLAEATGALVVCASPVPVEATAEFPILTSSRDLGALNKASWLPLKGARWIYRDSLRSWRDTLGLKPKWSPQDGTDAVFGAHRTLVATSKYVLPKPRDWSPNTFVTGYWRLPPDTEWTPDPNIVSFLEDGPPPIYIGFGSMPVPEELSDMIAGALVYSSARAIVSAGWSGLSVKSDYALNIGSVPHDWLFQRVAGVVHHGGAGTTAAGLRAGQPTLICPAGVDQPFWGRRVQRLGCGPEPLPMSAMERDTLAERIRATLRTARYQQTSKALGLRIQGEDGLTRSADLIEATLAARRPPR